MKIDRKIDRLELEIDDACLLILARRQPVASDLRLITTTMKLVTDLERIGDLGTNVCERVLELSGETPESAVETIVSMAAMAKNMLHEALDAFVEFNAAKAERIIESDAEVDKAYAELFPALVELMCEKPDYVHNATRLLSLGKYLERIADHSTNISEMVVFMVKGEDIRHAFGLASNPPPPGSSTTDPH